MCVHVYIHIYFFIYTNVYMCLHTDLSALFDKGLWRILEPKPYTDPGPEDLNSKLKRMQTTTLLKCLWDLHDTKL